MFRYGPRFGMPIDPYMAPPMADVQFRGGPKNGPLSQQGGGSMASGSMQGPQGQGGGGLGLGDAAGAAGLLSKLGGPQATSVMDPGFLKQAAGWAAPDMGGAWPEMAMNAGGGGGGLLGSLGGVAGGMTGADLGPMADLGIEAAAGGGNALSLSNPATAALAAPGLLNMIGIDVPNPMSWLTDQIGGWF